MNKIQSFHPEAGLQTPATPVTLERHQNCTRCPDSDVDGDDLYGGAVVFSNLESKVLLAFRQGEAS